MKTRWLVILFILYLAVVLVSLLSNQKNNKPVAQLSKQETTQIDQPESAAIEFSSQPAKAPIKIAAPLPTAKSGITIIETPMEEPGNSVSAVEINEQSQHPLSVRSASSLAEEDDGILQQAGITKEGRYPPLKERKEMNSRGIVLY